VGQNKVQVVKIAKDAGLVNTRRKFYRTNSRFMQKMQKKMFAIGGFVSKKKIGSSFTRGLFI